MTISRDSIKEEVYREILDVETHHSHEIIDDGGVFRWKKNEHVRDLANKIGINDIVDLFYSMGYSKNSEVFRKFYRDIGSSLYAYWEVFYWEVNNEESEEYIEDRKAKNRDIKINTIIS